MTFLDYLNTMLVRNFDTAYIDSACQGLLVIDSEEDNRYKFRCCPKLAGIHLKFVVADVTTVGGEVIFYRR